MIFLNFSFNEILMVKLFSLFLSRIMSSKRKSPPTKLSSEELGTEEAGDGGDKFRKMALEDGDAQEVPSEDYDEYKDTKGKDSLQDLRSASRVLVSEEDEDYDAEEEDDDERREDDCDDIEDDDEDDDVDGDLDANDDAMSTATLAGDDTPCAEQDDMTLKSSKCPPSDVCEVRVNKKRRMTAAHRQSKHFVTSDSDSDCDRSFGNSKLTLKRLDYDIPVTNLCSTSSMSSAQLHSSGSHTKRSMKDVLKRLTSKMHGSSLRDAAPGGSSISSGGIKNGSLHAMVGQASLDSGHRYR